MWSTVVYDSISSASKILGLKRGGRGSDAVGMVVSDCLFSSIHASWSNSTSQRWTIQSGSIGELNASLPITKFHFPQPTLSSILSDDFHCGDWLLYVVSLATTFSKESETHARFAFLPRWQIDSPRTGSGRGVVHGRVRPPLHILIPYARSLTMFITSPLILPY